MALTAILFGLIATIAWGVGDYLGARAAKKLTGYTAAFLVLSAATVTYAIIYLLFLRSHTVFDAEAIAYAVVAGISFTIANLAFYKGLELGPVSIVSPLGSLYPLITALLLVAVFGSQLSARQALGVAVVVGGAMIASGLIGRGSLKKGLSRGPLLGLVAALFWGIAFGLITQSVNLIGWQFASLVELVCGALAYLPLLALLNRGAETVSPSRLLRSFFTPLVLIAGLLIEAGFLAVTIGIGEVGELAPTVVAVSACYPILTVFLALSHFKEKFQLVPMIGAFTGIAGIVILSLG